jgi:hypothetical protein
MITSNVRRVAKSSREIIWFSAILNLSQNVSTQVMICGIWSAKLAELKPGLKRDRHVFHSSPFIERRLCPPTIGLTVSRLVIGLGRLFFCDMVMAASGLKVTIAGGNVGHISRRNISVSGKSRHISRTMTDTLTNGGSGLP